VLGDWEDANTYTDGTCHDYFCLPACLARAIRINPGMSVSEVRTAACAVPCFSHLLRRLRVAEEHNPSVELSSEPAGPEMDNQVGCRYAATTTAESSTPPIVPMDRRGAPQLYLLQLRLQFHVE